ncbi:plant UBX domain-containing protein 1-like [Juglans microcarpa x Juglans regia]|uniref:plant UBX domain-containing protein 1-like n=1 Tax=Juglans microcarpa x Juglans regia TaxID=2249226 RepID=UPI001B7DE91A|nr:plant UBX domain-containing protein 1-like [Juglans microcarpa x Juglans regia]
MVVDAPAPLPLKRRRRLTNVDPMEFEAAKAKFAAMKEKVGREIRVFQTSALSPSSNEMSNSEETDDFYEFTAEDYFQILATKKEDKSLKTRKIRDSEAAARRSKITKAIIRVRFPDLHTLEVTFHPSETIQSLIDLITKVIARPELPFFIYTTPPKKQIKDMAQDFCSAGFVPGAIVYFSYVLPAGVDSTVSNLGPFLQEEIMSLKDLEFNTEQRQQAEAAQSSPESKPAAPAPVVQDHKPLQKKPVKPKWLKM